MKPLLLLLLLTISSAAQTSQPSTSAKESSNVAPSDSLPEILILGTYHMSNPGRDIYNMKVDDVTSPKRQQEIAQLIEVLKKFRPTKIAIESTVGSTRRTQQYTDYLGGKYTLTSNEIEQIGFRLAKELGHTQIYPVDEDGDFPWLRVQNWAKANGQIAKLDALNAWSEKRTKDENAYVLSHSVLDTLLHVNSDAHVAQDMSWYFEVERFGEPYEYAGPDLLASWYQRNIRIYHNVVHLIDRPQERILVIYGYGHLGWLRQNAANDRQVKLRTLEEFAKP